ncbi:MAG: hypothetical protein ACTSXF_01850 [Promethearchaeota archaeon]
MKYKNQIEKIKELIEKKFTLTNFPENGDECLIVREMSVGSSYNAEVGIGKCWKYTNYYDIIGYVYNSRQERFIDSSIRVEKKLPKSTKVLCGVAKKGFYEYVDKTMMGLTDYDWKGTLDDLINLIEFMDEKLS